MSYTYHQAKNPTTINITDEHVTESELPERLAELNRKTTALEYYDDNTITEIPKMRTDELRVKGSNMNDVLSITSGMDPHELIMNFYNDKSATCYGALVATNVNWSNKTDIEALQTKTNNMSNQLNQVRNDVTGIYHDDGYIKMQDPVWFESSINGSTINGIYTLLTGITQTAINKSGTIIGSNVLSNNETRLVALENKTQYLNSDGTVLTAPSFTYDTGATGNTSSRTFKIQRGTGHMTFGNAASHGENFFPMFTSKPVGDASFQLRAHQGTAESVNPPFLFQLAGPTGGAISGVKKGLRFLNWANELAVLNTDGSFSCTGNITAPSLNGNRIGTPGTFIYNNYSPFIPLCDTSGVIEVGGSIDFHELTNEQDYRARLSCIGTNILELTGTASMRMTRIDVSVGMTLRSGNTLMKFTKSDPAINMLTLDATTDVATFLGNVVAPNLTGIGYINNLLLQTTDYTTATIISNHLHVNLNGMTYKQHMGIRAHKDDMTSGQEVMIQVGKSHTAAISFVYKQNDTHANCEYRLDHPGRVAYRCYYGSTKTEHEIRGNLKIFGALTENASKTITHYTQYEGELQPGFFVESTGQIFHNEEPSYENCMVTVKQATTFSNNIIGVCVEVMNEEITDEYGNVNQPAGKFCRVATHGDCLIKCISDTYHIGDIIIPSSSGGYGKKGSSMEIIDCMTHMVPRLKITSLETDEIDPQCVVGFITV